MKWKNLQKIKQAQKTFKQAKKEATELFNKVKDTPGDFYDNTKTALKEKYGENGAKFDAKVSAKVSKMVVKCKAKSKVSHCIDCEDHPSKNSPWPCKIARWEPPQ